VAVYSLTRITDTDDLTIEDLEKSAKLANLSLDAAVQTLIKTVDVAKKEPGHEHR
jgi:hypothetical protein